MVLMKSLIGQPWNKIDFLGLNRYKVSIPVACMLKIHVVIK